MILRYQQGFLAPLDFAFPKEYLAYLFTAESTYKFGWAYLIEADELAKFNADHEAAEFYPGYFLIGAHDGGAFAIEKATGRFVEPPLSGHDEETPIILGLTWPEFLAYLQTKYP